MSAPLNRLAGSTSPYLLQHAGNPVDWYPWGEEALARARADDKPILLSIGYSACHWCHVMAHESFEDAAIAALMNEHFVCMKVDREERPDLDDIYMAATLAMNHGHGGWPMTVFLTPGQEPFFAGTYFPPEDRHGRPGFPAILRRIAELWRDNRAALERVGGELTAHLRQSTELSPGAIDLDAALARLLDQLTATFDPAWGGFGQAPKFPPATLLRLLLRIHRRDGDPRTLHMVRRTLDGMARGGMYDQLGGGFCRYATDDEWLVPHFEKMLYDNALLVRAYLEGYQVTAEPLYRQVAADVLDYVLREMTAPEGGFHSATDADSEGVEGKFFVWTPAEFKAVLGPDAALAAAWFDVSEMGNWEGHSILRTPRPLAEVAAEFGLEAEVAGARLAAAREKLYLARGARVPPGLDDKVLTSWNGLMIGALSEGARVLGEARWLAAAGRAADFVLEHLRGNAGRLLRSWRRGTAHLNGYLEDSAFFGNGLIDLYEAGGGVRYLVEARAIATRMIADFGAPDGGFFSTSADHEVLLVRHREGHDGAVPSANAMAAHLLARLAAHDGREEWRAAARAALGAWGAATAREPRAFAESLMALDFLREGPLELAFVGAPGDHELKGLERAVAGHFLPHRIIGHHDPAAGQSAQPLLAGKTLVEGRSALYVCRDFACQTPVTEAEEVARALGMPSA
jgi:uncharacterized protein YyaL (SSP411 family)